MKKTFLSVICTTFLLCSCEENYIQQSKMDTIELNDGQVIKCKALSEQERNALKSNYIGEPIWIVMHEVQVQNLNDGRILVSQQGYYTLYFSMEDLSKVLLNASGSTLGREIMFNKNPYGKLFPANTSRLINELTSELGVNTKELDELTLKNIDDKISALPDASDFRKKHIIHFIAIIGEILIKKYNGSWYMIKSNDNVTWNPYVKIENRQTQFFSYLYEDIFARNSKNDASLLDVFSTMVAIAKNN